MLSKHKTMAITAANILSFSAVLMGTASKAGAAVTQNVTIPFAQDIFVPCANKDAGEVVFISGNLHVLEEFTSNQAGGFVSKFHFQPQGATGKGLVTGDVYRATGVTQETVTVQGDGLPYEFTYVNNFKIIGPGSNNNLLVHDTIHVTINNNGQITAQVTNSSVECR